MLAALEALADPGRRREGVRSLAEALGCEDVMFFAPDPEVDVILPAPGLAQTLPGARAWKEFLARCTTDGESIGEMPRPEGGTAAARGIAGPHGIVAVLTGDGAVEADLTPLRPLLPVLGALFVAERRAEVAEVRISSATEAVERAGVLTESLQATRAKLERALLEAETARAVMDAFYSALPVPAALVDTDLRFRRINGSLAALYGIGPEEVVGKHLEEVVPYANTILPYYHRVLETGESLRDVEISVPDRVDATFTRHYLVNYFPVRLPGGELVGVGVVALDVTDRQRMLRADREHTRVVDTLQRIGHSLTAELDLRKLVQAVTDAGTELTGAQFGAFFYNVLTAEGEAYTLYTIAGVPREEFSKFPMPRNTEVFAPTFHGEGVVRSDDITQDPRYGHNEPYHGMPEGHLPVRSYLAVPVTSRSGEVLGGLFFGHEDAGVFDERKEQLAVGIAGWAAVAMDNARLFEAERRALAEAERANRVKSDFLAVMSHELRTPLNAIIGYAGLMMSGVPEPVPAQAQQKLERIDLSARHLLELIEEILTFSRLEAGEETVQLEQVDLERLVTEVEALLEPLALEKGIGFVCDVADGLGTMVSDARKIRQVLINLLTNAVKFTEEGVVGLMVEEVGGEVVLKVHDTGGGIAPEHHKKVFEPFWQVENSSTRSAGGTGLGLSVTRRLVHLLGGEITLTSDAGQGSTFVVRLPMRPYDTAARSSQRDPAGREDDPNPER